MRKADYNEACRNIHNHNKYKHEPYHPLYVHKDTADAAQRQINNMTSRTRAPLKRRLYCPG